MTEFEAYRLARGLNKTAANALRTIYQCQVCFEPHISLGMAMKHAHDTGHGERQNPSRD